MNTATKKRASSVGQNNDARGDDVSSSSKKRTAASVGRDNGARDESSSSSKKKTASSVGRNGGETSSSAEKKADRANAQHIRDEIPSRFRLYGFMPVWLGGNGPESDVVLSTRVRLARNLADRKFPMRASARDKMKIFDDAAAAFGKISKPYGKFEVIDFSKLRKLEQHFLVEERLASIDMLKGDGARGVACDVSRKYSVMINEEDHLRIQGIDAGFRTFDLWDNVSALDDAIGSELQYAYTNRLGYLTSCPSNSGTGLRLSYLMHLPGLVLTRAVEPVLQGAAQIGIATRGFFGERSDVVGNFFQLSNQATMGAGETDFIERTSKVVREIIDHERAARKRLLKDASLEVSDKICRACGLLYSARLLNFIEMLNLTSAIRLGISCGAYKEHTEADINKITIIGMPAHLQIFVSGRKEADDDPDAARAEVVRELLAASRVGAGTAKPSPSTVKKSKSKS